MMNYSKQVPAAERTLNILEALAGAPDGLLASELLAQLDLSRSALFALLNTLKARQYIEQADSRGPYQLGPALWALVPGRPHGLGALVEAFQSDTDLGLLPETAALAWLDRQETVILTQKEGQRAVRVVFRPGERQPATVAAGGLVLLAGLSPDRLAQQFPQEAKALTAVLQTIRQQSLAQTEHDDRVEMACPVCADGVQPVAALLVSLPRFRCDEETIDSLKQQLRQSAARLSYRLGAAVYQPYGWAVGDPIGPVRPLNETELARFLQGPWGARLACVRSDGTPHVLPLWYEWDGRFVWLTASPGAQWKNVIQDSRRVSLTIDEPWPPLRRAFIEGEAEFVPADEVPGGLEGLRRRLAARYLGQGADRRQELCQTAGWQAVRIVPERLSGQQGLGSGL